MRRAELWSGIKLALQASTLDVKIQAALIDVMIEMGLYVTAIFKSHGFETDDTQKLDLEKSLAESMALTDKALALVEKYQSDDFHTDEQLVSALGKPRDDALNLLDAQSKALGYAKGSEIRCAISLQLALDRPLQDLALIVAHASLGVDKSAIESIALIHAIRRAMSLARMSDAQMRDGSQHLLDKVIRDDFDATDDADGALTTLDDQNVAMFKSLHELSAIGDSFARVLCYDRALIDGLLLASDVAIRLDHKDADGFGVDASATRALEKRETDAVGLQSTPWFALDRALSHGLETNAMVSILFVRAHQDRAAMLEALNQIIDKPLRDGLAVDELIDVKQAKGARDATGLTDSLLRSIGFQRSWFDALSTSTFIAKAFSQLRADAFAVRDFRQVDAGKGTSDALRLEDRQKRDQAKNHSDSLPVSDRRSHALERFVPADQLGFCELRAFTHLKLSANLIQWLDQCRRALLMQRLDLTGLSELLAKHGNVGFKDGLSLRDLSWRTPGKNAQDALRLNDAGSLWSQGYALDPGYFADDYVGVVRAF